MFDLEKSLVAWRGEMRSRRTLTRDQLAELEDHLVSVYESLLECRLAPGDAWTTAREALGAPDELSEEFSKVEGTGWRALVGAGLALFVVSFFLPAYDWSLDLFGSPSGGESFFGAQAFLFALQGEAGPIGVVSALTNALLLGAAWKLSDRGPRTVLLLGMAACAALLLNGWWLTQVEAISELQVGYFAWLSSFGLMASGLLARARSLADRMGLLTAG